MSVCDTRKGPVSWLESRIASPPVINQMRGQRWELILSDKWTRALSVDSVDVDCVEENGWLVLVNGASQQANCLNI